MDAKLQRRVQRYGWDKAASHYERSWQSQLEPAQSTLLDLAALEPGGEVLDVACGTGLVTLRAAAAIVPSGMIVGTDISEQMVLAARDIAAGRGTQMLGSNAWKPSSRPSATIHSTSCFAL
jgi:ubiquinone/menaquinone biosynthesis C-methylase UbiE